MRKHLDAAVLAFWLGLMWIAGRIDKAWLRWQIRRDAQAELRRKMYRGRGPC